MLLGPLQTKSMGDTVNGHKDLLSVLFALMRDRIREGKAGRRIKNISNFIKGFLLAANGAYACSCRTTHFAKNPNKSHADCALLDNDNVGADLEDGERQRDKVQFHDMKQYTSRADSSLLFYTRCAVAVYGPLLLNSVFYKHYPPVRFSFLTFHAKQALYGCHCCHVSLTTCTIIVAGKHKCCQGSGDTIPV